MSAAAGVVQAIAQLAENEAAFDPNSVTPGVLGFLVTALFALAVIFLGRDLVRRLRRGRYREEIREELAAELAAQDALREAAPGADAAAEAGGKRAEPGEPVSGDPRT